MGTFEVIGTGGILEGNLGNAAVNVNLDPVLELSGGTDHVSGAFYETPFTSSHTMSCWIKPADGNPAVEERFLSALGDTWPQNTATISLLPNGKITYNYKANNNNAMATPVSATFTDGECSWTHVAVTANHSTGGANGLSIYINGKEVALGSGGGDGSTGSTSGVTFADWDGDSATEIAIGALNNDYTLEGQIADVKVFTDILTDSEIEFLASKINCDSAHYGIDNRVGWWKLNEGSGTTLTDYDDNGTEYALSIQNPLDSSANWQFDAFSVNVQDSLYMDNSMKILQGKLEGKALTSLHFHSDNDFVSTSEHSDLSYGDGSADSPLTFAAWIRAEANNFPILSKGEYNGGSGSTAGEYAFLINSSGHLALELYDESESSTYIGQKYASAITLNQWVHVAGTYDATEASSGVKLYIDGVLVPSAVYEGGSYTAMEDGSANMMIGRSKGPTYANGQIRDLKLFEHELSAAQVASLYSGSYNVTPEKWYKLDDSIQGVNTTTAADSGSKTARDGSLSGFGATDGTYAGSGWSNGTAEVRGQTNIGSSADGVTIKGYFSAPRGNYIVMNHWSDNGKFIHNNGTVTSTVNGLFVNRHQEVNKGRSTRFYNFVENNGTVNFQGNAKWTYTTLNGAITDATATSVPVATALNLTAGEWLYVGSEYMRIESISGNTLTVSRGRLGSTAATHSNGADVKFFPVIRVEKLLDIDSTNSPGDQIVFNPYDTDADMLVEFGTDTDYATFENNGAVTFTTADASHNFVMIGGVSPLHPVRFTGIDIDWGANQYFDGTPAIGLRNIDYQTAASIGGTHNVTVRLFGDCEFDALTVEDGDTLDLNGQRAVIGGLTSTGTGTITATNSLVYLNATSGGFGYRIHDNGTFTHGGSTFVVDSSGDPACQMQATGNTFNNIVFLQDANLNGGELKAEGFAKFCANNMATNNEDITAEDITIPEGGVLTAGSSTITASGDFTVSGGLIGLSQFDFNGASSGGGFINCGSHADIANIFDSGGTAEAWIRIDGDAGTASGMRPFSKDDWFISIDNDASGDVYKLRLYYFFSGDNGIWTSTDTVLSQDKWHHIAVTYDNGNVTNTPTMYVDGKSVKVTTTTPPTSSRDTDASAPLYLGNRADGARTFNGVMAMARIWSDIRTETEIRTNMFDAFASMTTPEKVGMLGMWQFDEGTGVDVDNVGSAGANADGTITANSSAWSSRGTYTRDTSTLRFNKSGAQTINFISGEWFHNLTVESGSTTNLRTNKESGGNTNHTGDLTVHGTFQSHSDSPSNAISFRNQGKGIHIPQSLNFNGSDEHVIATSAKGDIEWSGQAFTMASWVYMTDSSKNAIMSLVPSTSSNDGAVLIIDEDDSNHHNSLALSFKEYGTSSNDNTVGVTAAATLHKYKWHHIAVTYSGGGSGTIGNYNFYIDGSLFTTGKALMGGDFSGRTDTLTANKVYIGRDKTSYFDGNMADVRLYDEVLTAGEISTLAESILPNQGKTAGLIGWWKLDETSGTSAADSSANSNAGTHTNTPTKQGNKATAVAGLNNFTTVLSSGTLNWPSSTVKNFQVDTSGDIVKANGDITFTTMLDIDAGATFKANGNTITTALADMDGGILDMEVESSKLAFTGTSGFPTNSSGTLKLGHADLAKGGIGALTFAGAGRVDMNDIDQTAPFSTSAWVKYIEGENIINKESSWYLYVKDSTKRLRFDLTGLSPSYVRASVSDSEDLLNGSWHHVAATFDGTTSVIYIDGAQVATDDHTGTIAQVTSDLNIGGTAAGGAASWSGTIGDVRIYSSALDANAISELYNSGNPQPEIVHDSISNWWKGDDATGSTLTDVISGNNGSISNATWTNASIVASDGSTDYNFDFNSGDGTMLITGNHALIDSNAGTIRPDSNQTHTLNDIYFAGSRVRWHHSGSSYRSLTFNRCRWSGATGGANVLRTEGGGVNYVLDHCRFSDGDTNTSWDISNSQLTLLDCIFEANYGAGSAPTFVDGKTVLRDTQAQLVIKDPRTSFVDKSMDRYTFISPSNGSDGSEHFGQYADLNASAQVSSADNLRIEDIYGSRSPYFEIDTNNVLCKSLFVGADCTLKVNDDVDFYAGAVQNNGTIVGTVIDDGSSPFEIPNKIDALQVIDNTIDGELITGVNNLI
jgi:hypothetical protein